MYELIEPVRVREQIGPEEVVDRTLGLKDFIEQVNQRNGKIIQILRYDHEYDFLMLVEYPKE